MISKEIQRATSPGWDAATRRLRATYLVKVPESDVTRVGEGSKLRGGSTKYRFEGRTYDASDLVEWGDEYMAILVELQRGRWKRLEATPTKSGAGDTEDLRALKTPRKPAEDVVDLQELIDQTTAPRCRNCPTEEPAVLKLLGVDTGGDSVDAAGIFPVDRETYLAFKVLNGDSSHAVPPIFLSSKGCATSRPIDPETRFPAQISLSASGGYLLVAAEYTSPLPGSMTRRRGRKVASLPRSRSAVWFPAP